MRPSMMPRLLPSTFSVSLPGSPDSRNLLIDPQAPANLAMTDFRSAPVVTAAGNTPIDDALAQMKRSGARFAFVVDPEGRLLGSVTSYDIQGEKPMQYMASIGCSENTCAWRDVLIENIMEPVASWRVLEYAQVVRMSVAEISDLLAESGMRYLVVVETATTPQSRQVRGLFSAARLQALTRNDGWSPQVTRGMTSVGARELEALTAG